MGEVLRISGTAPGAADTPERSGLLAGDRLRAAPGGSGAWPEAEADDTGAGTGVETGGAIGGCPCLRETMKGGGWGLFHLGRPLLQMESMSWLQQAKYMCVYIHI